MVLSHLSFIPTEPPNSYTLSLHDALPIYHQVIACYTQPDRPAGRGRKLTPSPVKELALQHDIPVFQPLNFKQDRKSTRLNSSHVKISYAVFCLKKKKNKSRK